MTALQFLARGYASFLDATVTVFTGHRRAAVFLAMPAGRGTGIADAWRNQGSLGASR